MSRVSRAGGIKFGAACFEETRPKRAARSLTTIIASASWEAKVHGSDRLKWCLLRSTVLVTRNRVHCGGSVIYGIYQREDRWHGWGSDTYCAWILYETCMLTFAHVFPNLDVQLIKVDTNATSV